MFSVQLLRSSPGVHRTEEGHQEDVCHEVHEQAKMCGAE